MNDEEIDSMPAGREMDILIAGMMGWRRLNNSVSADYMAPPQDAIQPKFSSAFKVPHYSTNIQKAWLVVEKFWCGFGRFQAAAAIDLHITDWFTPEDCFCRFQSPTLAPVEASGNSIPLAICRAALKAVSRNKYEPQTDSQSE